MERQDLEIIRENIDKVDKQLVELLEKRIELVKEVGLYKSQRGLPVYDGNREEKVIEKYKSYLKNDIYYEYIEELCYNIMKVCKDVQKNEVF